MFTLAILAAVGCALCNGVAAILQKVGADSQKKVDSLNAGLLLKLTRNAPYVGGLTLDLLGWSLTVFAVRFIPLFLAEAVIASSVAVTALLDRLVLRHRLPRNTWASLAVLLLGLGLLGASATQQTAVVVRGAVEWAIILAPVGCLAVGALLARSHSRASAFILAFLSGVAFGGTSVVGRVLPITAQWWHLLVHPLFWSLVVYGVTGVWLFTIALQRGLATTINASMTAAQTLVPATVGLIFLSDDIRGDLWIFLVAGLVSTLIGVFGVARSSSVKSAQKSIA